MVLQAIVWTVLAWFAGLLLDANLSLQPAGFLCLRVLLPILAMIMTAQSGFMFRRFIQSTDIFSVQEGIIR